MYTSNQASVAATKTKQVSQKPLRIIFATFALAIIAYLTPILLRGSVRLPVLSGARPFLQLRTQSLSATAMSTTSTKLTPKELKEWNQYVTTSLRSDHHTDRSASPREWTVITRIFAGSSIGCTM